VLDDAVLNEWSWFGLFNGLGLGLHSLNLFFLGVRDECEGCLLKHNACENLFINLGKGTSKTSFLQKILKILNSIQTNKALFLSAIRTLLPLNNLQNKPKVFQ
jgi:hypothetical protein